MGNVVILLHRIICHDTTEAGHDEVYYDSPVIARAKGDEPFTADPRLATGPGPGQLGNAQGLGSVDNTAWDCNDSGAQKDQTLNVELFPVEVRAGEHVIVSLSFKESDGDNYADAEARWSAMVSAGLIALTAAVPPIGLVTIPLTLAAEVVSGIVEGFHSVLGNVDDDLGSMTLHLQGDGETVQLTQVGVAGGQLVQMSADGKPARAVVHCKADGEYTYFIGVRGATTKKAEGLTFEAPLTSDLPARDFVSWTSAHEDGARGTWLGREVILIGPMGTAFYLHDDYPNFSQPAFTPRLPATGMVEVQSQPGHNYIVLFSSPIQDPVLMLGSLGSVLTLPEGVNASLVSGDERFVVNGNVIRGGETGHPDSNGTARLTGTYRGFSFTLEPNPGVPGVPGDGVFLQIGGTPPF